MLKPERVLKLIKDQTSLKPLEEARFIRIAMFETPDDPRVYNGLAAHLAGDDMYGEVLLLKTLEEAAGFQGVYQPNTVLTVSEWEWNGGEDLSGELLTEASELYNNFLLERINKEIKRLSDELEETENETKLGHISYDALDNIRCSIQRKAAELWLNQYGGSRVPEWFEELEVPENMRNMFDDIFIDF